MTVQTTIAPGRPAPGPVLHEEETAEEVLLCLLEGIDLTQVQAETVFGALVAGRLDDPTIAAMLVALRLKGETTDELIGGARALRAGDAIRRASASSSRRNIIPASNMPDRRAMRSRCGRS
ncbi:MAG: hypothetical protein LC634_06310 [Sphingomonadales bacterium]|nr:hypothetical protein [Sphingomonadales bacterium]